MRLPRRRAASGAGRSGAFCALERARAGVARSAPPSEAPRRWSITGHPSTMQRAQHRLHRRRRPRLRRPRLLRRPRSGFAGARPAGRRRPALHAGLCELAGLLADALRADDRALPVPAARRRRGADQQQEPRQHDARPAARASDPAVAAARRRLPHGADRQVAPRLSAGVRAAALGLRRVLRADVGRRRLLHPLRFARRARPLARRGRAPRGGLPHRPDLAPRGRLRSSASPRPAARRSSSACTTPRRTGRGRRATTRRWPPK